MGSYALLVRQPFDCFLGIVSTRTGFYVYPLERPGKTVIASIIILHLQLTKNYAFRPSCGTRSKHLHSRYDRFLYDLSMGDQHVSIPLTSRKWFCDEFFCPQRIFMERFSWIKPYTRQTSRLQQLLRKIAFSMSCRQAEKVACSFPPFISHDALLRMIRATSITLPARTTIRLDDFSFRKGIGMECLFVI